MWNKLFNKFSKNKDFINEEATILGLNKDQTKRIVEAVFKQDSTGIMLLPSKSIKGSYYIIEIDIISSNI